MYKKIYRSMCAMAVTTLLLSAIIILCVCYTSFCARFTEQVKNECLFASSLLNAGKFTGDALESAVERSASKRISIISKDGSVLYDNNADASDTASSPETKDAFKKGFSEAQRRSKTDGKRYYYCAARLKDGSVLKIGAPLSTASSMLATASMAVFFVAFLVFLTLVVIAKRLTENILLPFENIYSFDNTGIDNAYEEIRPFLKRIERQNNEIQRQMEKVDFQRARLRAIMDNINEGIVIVANSGEVLSVNRDALDIFGGEKHSVKHRAFSELTDREDITQLLKSAMNGKKDTLTLDANGKTYSVFASPMTEKNKIIGAVLLLIDVSEKSRPEKLRREFTANVSHELKTPLTAIHGYAQLICSGIAKDDDIPGFVGKIEKESSRLITLVDDIIELSHLDEGTGGGEKESVELLSVAKEVAESLQPQAKKRSVSINVTGTESTVTANLSQITEMLYNLTDNAIKYNKPGGNVTVKVLKDGVSVADTGIGIPEKYHERIFERFFRVDKSHSKMVNGTGLGLSIVKHLAIINNADISVKSTLGEGTEFTVMFG